MKTILRWLGFTLLGLLGTAALIYVGDAAVFYMRGKPQYQIVTSSQLAAPLKGNKTDYYYEGTGPTPCARALFPEAGLTPCWYLRRHPIITETL